MNRIAPLSLILILLISACGSEDKHILDNEDQQKPTMIATPMEETERITIQIPTPKSPTSSTVTTTIAPTPTISPSPQNTKIPKPTSTNTPAVASTHTPTIEERLTFDPVLEARNVITSSLGNALGLETVSLYIAEVDGDQVTGATIEYIEPDRLHFSFPLEGNNLEIFIVDNVAYGNGTTGNGDIEWIIGGIAPDVNDDRWSSLLDEIGENLIAPISGSMPANDEVSFLGSEIVEDIPLLVYQYELSKNPFDDSSIEPAVIKVWIGADDGLLYREEVTTLSGETINFLELRYDFSIDAPVSEISEQAHTSSGVVVSVDSTLPRTSTGIHIDKGTTVRVSFEDGSWRAGPYPTWPMVGPSGDMQIPSDETFPVTTAPVMSLIAGVGDNDPFLVGEGIVFTNDTAGILWFGANDDIFEDNDGAITIRVSIEK